MNNDNLEEMFKKITGLDLKNHTNEEWQSWYHEITKQIAKENAYEREILNSAERIIENKDYSQLCAILKNYDHYVKLTIKDIVGLTEEYPFWCQSCIFK